MEHCCALRLSLCILLVLNITQPVARAAADTLDPAVYARVEALLGPNLVDKAMPPPVSPPPVSMQRSWPMASGRTTGRRTSFRGSGRSA